MILLAEQSRLLRQKNLTTSWQTTFVRSLLSCNGSERCLQTTWQTYLTVAFRHGAFRAYDDVWDLNTIIDEGDIDRAQQYDLDATDFFETFFDRPLTASLIAKHTDPSSVNFYLDGRLNLQQAKDAFQKVWGAGYNYTREAVKQAQALTANSLITNANRWGSLFQGALGGFIPSKSKGGGGMLYPTRAVAAAMAYKLAYSPTSPTGKVGIPGITPSLNIPVPGIKTAPKVPVKGMTTATKNAMARVQARIAAYTQRLQQIQDKKDADAQKAQDVADRLNALPPVARFRAVLAQYLGKAAAMNIQLNGLSNLTADQAAEYAKTLGNVLGSMSKQALQRMAEFVKEMNLFASLSDLRAGMAAVGQSFNSAAMGAIQAKGNLYLDGASASQSISDIWSHELSHGIDIGGEGKANRLSNSAAWQSIYVQEMFRLNAAGSPILSRYAMVSASEAFAEFGRLLYSGTATLAQLQQMFPKSLAFFQQNGLVPGEPTQTQQQMRGALAWDMAYTQQKLQQALDKLQQMQQVADARVAQQAAQDEQVAATRALIAARQQVAGLQVEASKQAQQAVGISQSRQIEGLILKYFGNKIAVSPVWQTLWSDGTVSRMNAAQAASYRRSLERVLSTMPQQLLDLISGSVKEIRYFGSIPALAKGIRDNFEASPVSVQIAAIATLAATGGAYALKDGILFLDGGMRQSYPGMAAEMIRASVGSQNSAGYAYLLGKAVAQQFLSSDPLVRSAWLQIWASSHQRLSELASLSPESGFAEFIRLLYASKVATGDIERQFPMAAQFFKAQGLWPTEETGRTGRGYTEPLTSDQQQAQRLSQQTVQATLDAQKAQDVADQAVVAAQRAEQIRDMLPALLRYQLRDLVDSQPTDLGTLETAKNQILQHLASGNVQEVQKTLASVGAESVPHLEQMLQQASQGGLKSLQDSLAKLQDQTALQMAVVVAYNQDQTKKTGKESMAGLQEQIAAFDKEIAQINKDIANGVKEPNKQTFEELATQRQGRNIALAAYAAAQEGGFKTNYPDKQAVRDRLAEAFATKDPVDSINNLIKSWFANRVQVQTQERALQLINQFGITWDQIASVSTEDAARAAGEARGMAPGKVPVLKSEQQFDKETGQPVGQPIDVTSSAQKLDRILQEPLSIDAKQAYAKQAQQAADNSSNYARSLQDASGMTGTDLAQKLQDLETEKARVAAQRQQREDAAAALQKQQDEINKASVERGQRDEGQATRAVEGDQLAQMAATEKSASIDGPAGDQLLRQYAKQLGIQDRVDELINQVSLRAPTNAANRDLYLTKAEQLQAADAQKAAEQQQKEAQQTIQRVEDPRQVVQDRVDSINEMQARLAQHALGQETNPEGLKKDIGGVVDYLVLAGRLVGPVEQQVRAAVARLNTNQETQRDVQGLKEFLKRSVQAANEISDSSGPAIAAKVVERTAADKLASVRAAAQARQAEAEAKASAQTNVVSRAVEQAQTTAPSEAQPNTKPTSTVEAEAAPVPPKTSDTFLKDWEKSLAEEAAKVSDTAVKGALSEAERLVKAQEEGQLTTEITPAEKAAREEEAITELSQVEKQIREAQAAEAEQARQDALAAQRQAEEERAAAKAAAATEERLKKQEQAKFSPEKPFEEAVAKMLADQEAAAAKEDAAAKAQAAKDEQIRQETQARMDGGNLARRLNSGNIGQWEVDALVRDARTKGANIISAMTFGLTGDYKTYTSKKDAVAALRAAVLDAAQPSQKQYRAAVSSDLQYQHTDANHPIAQAIRADTETSQKLGNFLDSAKHLVQLHNDVATAKQNLDTLARAVRSATGTDQQDRIIAAHAAVAQDHQIKQAALNDSRAEARQLLIDAVGPKTPLNLQVQTEGLDKSQSRGVQAAREFISSIADKSLTPSGQVSIAVKQNIGDYVKSNGDTAGLERSFYSPRDNAVYLRQGVSGDAAAHLSIHELGHGVEANAKALDNSAAFRAYRTQNTPNIDMSKVGGNAGEIGNGDDFGRVIPDALQAAYTGRAYIKNNLPTSQNEIMSMGLEHLYKDPVKFVSNDPEFAHFVIGTLQGKSYTPPAKAKK